MYLSLIQIALIFVMHGWIKVGNVEQIKKGCDVNGLKLYRLGSVLAMLLEFENLIVGTSGLN